MTTTPTTGHVVESAERRIGRPPAPAVTAAVLSILLALFGGYGAIYFSGLEGWDDTVITFVTTYEAISAFVIVSAVALLRGSSHGRVGLVAYGAFMVIFTVMKLLTIQELEAIPFGVVGLVIVGLALHSKTRRFAA